jgi:alanyl-tRNA synthetase
MTSHEIRKAFLEFFESRGHRIVPSSPLILPRDPTLLFANAGMNQFKDVFTGREHRDYRRAASSQKCLRVSGKHNDLEQVGRTPRHHTFFEMLGNFSFGDYFKAEAIEWAWDLVTNTWSVPQERLWVTVFGGTPDVPADEEAFSLWKDRIGVPEDRILRLGEKDNFWRMGDTGPCGPCSEIHFDLGEDLRSVEGVSDPETDTRRFVEIWNLVFMQFDQKDDGSLEPLPAPSIDTGMGLERITAVLQGKRSNYETDLFLPILDAAAVRAGTRYGREPDADTSLRVIADHVRALCFLVADGVVPANDKRGYVLRRVLRRAIRHGRKLGIEEPFLHEVSPVVLEQLGETYPELLAAKEAVLEVGRREEERFADTLAAGLTLLDQSIQTIPEGSRTLPGAELFRLYDTFGLPLDLAQDVAEERGVALDLGGFEEQLARQRARAQASWRGSKSTDVAGDWLDVGQRFRTVFEGYDRLRLDGVRVLAIVHQGSRAKILEAGQQGEVVLEATPFYAEAGGQVGDSGWLVAGGTRARVLDTRRPVDGIIAHRVRIEDGALTEGDLVTAEVDAERRESVKRNHTATHLVHAALREVVGTHVKQAGSLVAPDRLRFDFTHFSGLSDRALADIEDLVNREALRNTHVEAQELPLEEALRSGAMALFGERYGDRVRVITIGGFSKELCGGTHCARSADVGPFHLTQERGVASGTRRIEALTGDASLALYRRSSEAVASLERLLSVPRDDVVNEVERRLEQLRTLQRELEQTRLRAARESMVQRADEPETVAGIKVLAQRADGLAAAEMRTLADNLRQRLGSGVVILGREEAGKASLLVAVTEDLEKRVPAGKVARTMAAVIGGGGGGRPDMAEAGGKDPSRLDEALRSGVEEIGRLAGGVP